MIGLLTLAGIPTTIGVAEGVSQQKQQNAAKADESRMSEFHLDASCESRSSRAKEVHGKRIVLRDDKVYVSSSWSAKPSYTLRAFYISYPDEERKPPPLGLVSHVSDEPPMLNWVYVDKHTMEVKYGNRTQSREHHVGPWDWTEDQTGVTFEDWEGFMAVQEDGGEWQLFFDRDDDGLKQYGGKERRKLEVTLERKLCNDK